MKLYIFIITLSISSFFVNAQKMNDLTGYEYDSLYNGRTLADAWLNHTFDSLDIGCENNLAIHVYLKRLRLLTDYIYKHKPTSVDYFIGNFELVTGIESESDASYFGKINPTVNDIRKWKIWLKNNKNRLCYYEKYNILFVRTK